MYFSILSRQQLLGKEYTTFKAESIRFRLKKKKSELELDD